MVILPYLRQGKIRAKTAALLRHHGLPVISQGKSLVPDNVGTKDVFSIVVTKQPIDWYAINNAISKSTAADYAGKVADALHQNGMNNVRFAAGNGGTINFTTGNQQDVVICLAELNK